MNEEQAAQALLEMLIDYFDDSALQPPIQIGDDRHCAITDYRRALPSGHLPTGEGELMRKLLRLSRRTSVQEREDSQNVAEDWAELIGRKYPALGELHSEDLTPKLARVWDDLTPAQQDIVQVVREAKRRLNRKQIGTRLLQKELGQGVSKLKADLATLSKRLKVLPHRTDTKPAGYGLENWD